MVASAVEHPKRVGRYVLHDEIASGGMGTVHLGHLQGVAGFSRIVAIKRLHPLLGREVEVVQMFLDEARLAASVRHPNVVPTFDTIEADGDVLIVMEYVHGESLARLWRITQERGERIAPAIVSAIISGTLYGLHAAHEATNAKGEPLGIVHRDVSPANVLVGVDGVARVVDFGVAKAIGRAQTTRDGSIKGKIAYMAPEQLASRPMDRRSDIWAAGVVLWEALTGMRLFTAADHGQLVASVLYGDIQPPARLVEDLEPGLNAVTMRALAREPSDRYPNARAMCAALLEACPPAPPHQVGEWVELCAQDALAARAARIAELETSREWIDVARRSSTEPTTPERPPPAIASSPASRKKRAAVLTGVVASAAIAATAFVLHGGQSSPASASTTAPLAPATAAAPPVDATPTPAPAPPTPASVATVPVAPLASAPRPGATHRAAHPSVDCNPPYARDAEGHKIWKRACFHEP